MLEHRLAQAGFLALAVCAAAAVTAQTRPKTPTVGFVSVPGNVLNCKAGASECKITVRVEPMSGGSCQAFIDPAFIHVNKDIDVYFLLARSNMDDTEKYAFVNPGVNWISTPPSPTQLAFQGLTQNNTIAYWKTGKKLSGDLAFTAYVTRLSDGEVCTSTDPHIANDG